MEREVYRSPDYRPEDVTGRYVRCNGRYPNFVFRVFETSTGRDGKPGFGPTLREYDTDGAELPKELRDRCVRIKQTEKMAATMIGYYVTIVRTGRPPRVRYLAGPYRIPPAPADVAHFERMANDYDPWTCFDAFGTAKVEAPQLPIGIFGKGDLL